MNSIGRGNDSSMTPRLESQLSRVVAKKRKRDKLDLDNENQEKTWVKRGVKVVKRQINVFIYRILEKPYHKMAGRRKKRAFEDIEGAMNSVELGEVVEKVDLR